LAAKRPVKKTGTKQKAPENEPATEQELPNVPETTPEAPVAPEPVSVPATPEKPGIPANTGPAPDPAPAQARKPDAIKNQSRNFEVVVFSLEKEQFAINLFDVKEVVEYSTITKLPNVPSYIQGIMDLRGEITTIIDLRNRLSLSAGSGEPTENSRIIVLDSTVTRVKTGILVDDVTSVSTFETSQVDYTSGAMNNEDTAILGIIKKKVKVHDKETSELIIWLDIRKLIEDIEEA
jgi:purine-binding chemotaxis protein CheW